MPHTQYASTRPHKVAHVLSQKIISIWLAPADCCPGHALAVCPSLSHSWHAGRRAPLPLPMQSREVQPSLAQLGPLFLGHRRAPRRKFPPASARFLPPALREVVHSPPLPGVRWRRRHHHHALQGCTRTASRKDGHRHITYAIPPKAVGREASLAISVIIFNILYILVLSVVSTYAQQGSANTSELSVRWDIK